MKRSSVAVLSLLFLLSSYLAGQEFRSTISGAVKDSSGSAVPNATVVAIETRTGTKTQAVSDVDGNYTLPFLLPGTYTITAEVPGFKKFERQGLDITSGAHPVVDITLQIGSSTETINVVGDVPLVDTANASAEQVITTKQVEDLPVNGRTPLMLAQLAIGVLPEGSPSLVHPFDNGGAADFSLGGSPIQSSELLLDGSPDATWDGRVAYNPPMDAVQEVRVDAFDSDAAYGHSQGGIANQILKSGTNSFHGSAWEFNQTSALNAVPYFSNSAGLGAPTLHFNQYGLTAGAPVIVPKIYNGKNKLFWFFAWEDLKDNTPTTVTTSVPTAAERTGDFSALLPLSNGKTSYQIYNPYSGTLEGTTIVRTQAFPNNVIPSSLQNPIALAYMKFFPLPNVPGAANGENNYVTNAASLDNYDNELGRLDYNVGSNDKIFFDFRHNYRLQNKYNLFDNISTGSLLTRENWGSSIDEVHTFGGTSVLDVRLNWTRMDEAHSEPSAGFDPTTLGFPSYIASNSEHFQLPYITFGGGCGTNTNTSFQCLGDNGANNAPSESYQIFGDLTKVVGSHTVKMGTDVRQYRLSNITYGNASGDYSFGTNWTTPGTSSSVSAAPIGQDLASFLLGLPTGGGYDLASSAALQEKDFALYLQDDFRAKSNLTFNFGIRFDRSQPQTERFNRSVNGFDTLDPNPIQGAAQAAYAADYANKKYAGDYPIPPTAFTVPGGLTFENSLNTAIYRTLSHTFSPRFGFSWSPKALGTTTVIRGGFGIFEGPIEVSNINTLNQVGSTPLVNQEGFSQTTSFVATTNNYLMPTPGLSLSNPFPGGILQPTGASKGLATFLGQSLTFLSPQMSNPDAERWEFDIQHQFPSSVLLEVAYIGNHGVHLQIPSTQLNPIPRQYLSALPVRDAAVINKLSATVANPFAGLIPGTNLNSSTIALYQLLAPYPEFLSANNPTTTVGGSATAQGIIDQNNTAGGSYYESLNVRVEKRYSHGLSLIANYAYSRLIDETTYLNDTDPAPEKRVSTDDRPHHIVVGATYMLPLGKGQLVNMSSRWANALFGGWNVNGIYVWQLGQPIYWSADMLYTGAAIDLNPSETNGPAFNTAAFITASNQQFQYHIRTFSSTFPNLRQDGTDNLDASLLKNFNFTESKYLQLRFEVFNAFNHPSFGPPNVTPTSSAFGDITSQVNLPRQIQLGARFVF